MSIRMRVGAILLCASLLLSPAAAIGAEPAPEDTRLSTGTAQGAPGAEADAVTRLVAAIESAVRDGDVVRLRSMARPEIDRVRLSEFALSMTQVKVSDLTIKERDRAPLANGGQRLLLEILTVTEGEGRVWTWRLDVQPGGPGGPWMIADVERLAVITGLYRLAIDPASEYDVRNAVITAPDKRMTLVSGVAFTARVPGGPTALVFFGRGLIEFTPAADAERTQMRIFSGSDALRTAFSALFVRLTPAEFGTHVSEGALTPRAVDPVHLRRATQIFEAQLPHSFQIDLNDLSTSEWSLVPSSGDFVAEITTNKYGALTYARSTSEPEDISFFDRRRRRNISVYSSPEKLETRGRFFSEDDKLDYDITHYDVDTSFSPERMWIDGTTTLTFHARSTLNGTITIRLADPLVVRRIYSPELGRLLHLRVVGQNNVLVGLPGTVPEGTDFRLIVTYGGRLSPQSVDREAVGVAQEPAQQEIVIPPEPQWIYSNRSYWYPQGAVSNYATSRLAITVPGEYDAVASGTPEGEPTIVAGPPGQRPAKRFVYTAARPVRYLAFVVSRFHEAPPVKVALQDETDPLTLYVEANPHQSARMRQLGEKTADVFRFYDSLLADSPYRSFLLAIGESDLPGGHSPAYFALLEQPLPTTPFVWSNDPVAFQGYPSFFLAHEVAHQWWGQAVGGKNYHEQWLSEGFAQYFAAMYARKERGPDMFTSVLRQMRRWAMEVSPQGPVYLGYRLGHIRADSRVFRALVYNKGAMVLHMLRRLLGDEAFFAGLRDFYQTWRFKKAGTDDLRVAMEKAGGRPLDRFFERWIYASGTPTLRFTPSVQGSTVTVRFEQKDTELYDIPVTVTVTYAEGGTDEFVVAVTDRAVEHRFEGKRAVKLVEANRDGGALVDIVR
jgi:hypothetical protein